jgi:hypothetical protein
MAHAASRCLAALVTALSRNDARSTSGALRNLLASCLKLRGSQNTAGRYLLERLARYASSTEFDPSGTGTGVLAGLLQ